MNNLSAGSFPSELKTAAGYEAACVAAERWVTITQAQHTAILAALAYDKRKDLFSATQMFQFQRVSKQNDIC